MNEKFIVFFISYLYFQTLCLPDYPSLTYHILYSEGVKAYEEQEWQRCVSFFLRAIEDFKFFKKTTVACYKLCLFSKNYFDEHEYFTLNINQTLCLIKCRNSKFSYRNLELRLDVDDLMENYMHYHYLQYCFYKINDIDNAILHAYTYYLYNPEDDDMKNNLKLYQAYTNFTKSFKNSELSYHHEFYMNGVNSYMAQSWLEAIDYFEEALVHYFIKDEECHLLCYGPYKHIFSYDFITTISNIYALRLKCNRRCIKQLNTLPGEINNDFPSSMMKGSGEPVFLDDYLSSHYNYLQYSYYKIGDLISAASNLATYFIFDPFDKDMANNKKYYMQLGGLKSADFTPRKEAIDYHNRHFKEAQLLEFIEENFHSHNTPQRFYQQDDKIQKSLKILLEKDIITDNLANFQEKDELHIGDLFHESYCPAPYSNMTLVPLNLSHK